MISARKVSRMLARTTEGRIHRILITMRNGNKPRKKGKQESWKAKRQFRWNEA